MAKTYDFSRLELPDERVLAILRTKSTLERFQLANEANKTARALIAGHLKTMHPEWIAEQIKPRSRGECSMEQLEVLAYAIRSLDAVDGEIVPSLRDEIQTRNPYHSSHPAS